jgi:hypothetical protein
LIDTVKSRCIDIKIFQNEIQRLNIINSLIEKHKIDIVIDPKVSKLTPGQFLKFNYISGQNNISLDKDFLKNLTTLLNLFKIKKDSMYIDMIFFLTDSYFQN